MADTLAGDWLSLKLWTLREAAYLLCGREPEHESMFKVEMHSGSDVARAYRELKDATLVGDLKFIDADGYLMRRRVHSAEVIAWGHRRSQDRGLPFPEYLGTTPKRGGDDSALTHEVREPRETIERREAREAAHAGFQRIHEATLRGAAAPVGAAPAGSAESAGDRQRRRLLRFRELGGEMRQAGTGWQCIGKRGALAALVREEKAASRPRRDRSDVRNDLIAATEVHRGS